MEELSKQACQHDHNDHDHCDCCDHHAHDHVVREHAVHEHAAKEAVSSSVHLEVHLHEGAVVASGDIRMLVRGDEAIGGILGGDMKALARWVEMSDGIIGHIKASLETTRTDVFSITDCELSENSADAGMVQVKIAAIVYGVGPDEMLTRLEGLLKHLESVGTPARIDR